MMCSISSFYCTDIKYPQCEISESTNWPPDDGKKNKKKKRSRWGGDAIEKAFIPGMPTVIPQGMSKDQEEMYLSE